MRKITDSIRATIKALHRKGLSEREIARRVGFSRSAVWYQLRRA